MENEKNMIMIPRCDRVSIDLDSKNQLNLLRAYFNLNRFSDNVIVKETRNGFHVVGEVKGRTPEQNLHIRAMLNDCEGRLELDELRLRAGLEGCIETKFFYKKVTKYIKMKNGKLKKLVIMGRETDYNILSQQFWGIRHIDKNK